MKMERQRSTLYTAYFVAFIDFFGVGLIYPLFSSMLFDPSYPLLAAETSATVRGIWLGLLIALMPLAQFFCAPIWGAFSDSRGRKKPLQLSLVVCFSGYLMAVCGVALNSIWLLLISRIMVGGASGNTSIVQAAIADVSGKEQKGKNFGLYTMALGLGFAFGPFLGGLFSGYNYSLPFLFAALITAVNIVFTVYFFEETLITPGISKLKIGIAVTQLKQALRFPELRNILLASFLYNFGWSYFFEFAPVYLIKRFHFDSVELGFFYGVAGGFYALSTGLLIRPFMSRLRPELLFFMGILLTAMTIFTLLILPSVIWLWPVIFLLCFFVSFVSPSSITLISDSAKAEAQGEALGNLSSINAAAFMLSPLFSGTFVGAYPTLPIWLGGVIMIGASLLIVSIFGRRLFNKVEP